MAESGVESSNGSPRCCAASSADAQPGFLARRPAPQARSARARSGSGTPARPLCQLSAAMPFAERILHKRGSPMILAGQVTGKRAGI